MAREILLDMEFRRRTAAGAEEAAAVAAATLGPKGRCAVLEQPGGAPPCWCCTTSASRSGVRTSWR